MNAPTLAPSDVAAFVADNVLDLDGAGAPRTPLAFVDLDAPGERTGTPVRAARPSATLLVGLASRAPRRELDPLVGSLACTIVAAPEKPRSSRRLVLDDVDTGQAAIERVVAGAPRAAMTLAALLRSTARRSVVDGLVAESLAYSMLLAGPEFATWLSSRPRHDPPADGSPAVLLERVEDVLRVTLNRPHRHNAFGRQVRDGLVEAFELVERDPGIGQVEVTGAGKSFCSGGDLEEFGSYGDVALAHLIRLDRSVAARVHRCRERVHVTLHGACIGAGIEIPSFAGRVSACDDAFFQLPELAMGLVPGAGGTVGITRRIGRWRTAYMALTGAPVGVDTALHWGLIDDRCPQ